jgi:cysteinyl-tRNA synthetase
LAKLFENLDPLRKDVFEGQHRASDSWLTKAKALSQILFAFGFDLFAEHADDDIPISVLGLAEKRWAAKQAKDFAAADALRKELTTAGWAMLDGKDSYKLEPLKK